MVSGVPGIKSGNFSRRRREKAILDYLRGSINVSEVNRVFGVSASDRAVILEEIRRMFQEGKLDNVAIRIYPRRENEFRW